ncbi:MAG: winged helix-turn-helix transcriptional regulator [Pseudonocardiales bacterium]|nr:winged helix-turn-helix transcriptional regulator [Pseudonocardiales bacterium]
MVRPVITAAATRPDPGPAFHALSHAGRRHMLRLTSAGERTAGELAACCGLTRPATSQHLKVLREAGLVDVRALGNQRLYRVRDAGLAELRAFLDSFWADRLDALRAAVEGDS